MTTKPDTDPQHVLVALLAEIRTLRTEMQQAYDAMLDHRDTPGSWTQHQKDAYEERRSRFRSTSPGAAS